jgi:hypothetical protein
VVKSSKLVVTIILVVLPERLRTVTVITPRGHEINIIGYRAGHRKGRCAADPAHPQNVAGFQHPGYVFTAI